MKTPEFRCWSSLEYAEGDVTTHDDGSVTVEHLVLERGRKTKGGRTFEVDDAALDDMVANHGLDKTGPPIFVGHPADRFGAKRRGTIAFVKKTASGLVAGLRFLKDTAVEIAKGERTGISPTFTFKWDDEHGVARGAKLLDVGLGETPFQKQLEPLSIPAAAVGLSWTPAGEQYALSEVEDAKETDMTKEETQAAIQTALESVNKQLSDATADAKSTQELLADLEKQITDLKPATDDKTATELAEAKQQAEDAQKALDARDVLDLCQKGIDTGRLAPAQVEQFGTEDFKPLEWLEASSFDGVRGLRHHIQTAPLVVDLGERSSAGSGDGKGNSDAHQIALGIASTLGKGANLEQIEAAVVENMAD